MGEGESANVVSNTDSNGNCLLGKTLNGVSEKKDLEGDQGKASGDNGVKDLKVDVIKEMEEDQKAGGEVKDNNKVDDEEEVKEDEEVDSVEGKEEDNKDDNASENENLNEETEVKETVDSKEEKENVEAKKPDLDLMEAIGVHKGKDESSEKETIQEEEKGEHKVDKPKEEEKVEDSKIEIGLIKLRKGKNIGEKVISKRQETVDSKGEKESAEAKKPEVVVMEEVAVPEDKDERRKKKKVQEDEDEDKINKLEEEEKVDDSKVERELRKHGKGKINGEKVKRKRKETLHSEKEKGSVEAKKPELYAMEEEGISKDKDESSEKEKFQEEGKEEDEEKGSKKYRKGKINGEKVEEKGEVLKETEPRTPAISRPVRERKTVERLVTSIEKDAYKELHIAKGRGTPLKDIPNVTFKLSRRKTDDTLKLLHTILFGRRGKAIQVKSNISRFSGFVWHENEEKQMIKVKEKLDKCNKEKLLEFCDLLDIQISRATTRKEDIIAKLIDFLVAPQATTTALLAEKEKLIKGKKRKRTTKCSSRSGCAAKSGKKTEGSPVGGERKRTTDTEDESEVEGKDEEAEENENGVLDKSDDEIPEKSEGEEKNDSDNASEDVKKPRKTNKTSSTKKESGGKSKVPQNTVTAKPHSAPKRTSKKSSTIRPEFDDDDDDSDTSPKVPTRKKKIEEGGKKKSSSLNKSSSKGKTAEKISKGKGKSKEKVDPSADQLRDAVCQILKEVDFNTATFTDILKQLAKQFDVDLTPRKAFIKIIIQEELTKLADEADDEEDENAET
ncbi:unnamed protein product [Lupinus luteus]|uniref:DEK-C domain-containing protein n=1 Tax=Lupinus luteus TaxID=3873 RepID=A0AAV1X6R3_LUPLU